MSPTRIARRGRGGGLRLPHARPGRRARLGLFLGEPIAGVVVVCGIVIAAGVYLLNRA